MREGGSPPKQEQVYIGQATQAITGTRHPKEDLIWRLAPGLSSTRTSAQILAQRMIHSQRSRLERPLGAGGMASQSG